MSEMIYDNVIKTEMDRGEREEMMVVIYESSDAVRNDEVMINTEMMSTERQQALQHTGRVSVKNRRHRSVQVCLCLLSVLLFTAVIVICVYFTNQLLTHNYNLTKEREELLTHNYNLTKENERLLTKYSDLLNQSRILTEEREKFRNKSDELQDNLTAVTELKNHHIYNLTTERDELLTNNSKLLEEKKQCLLNTRSLSEERDQLMNERKELNRWLTEQDRRSDNLKWIYYNFSFYYISSEYKSWSDSRRDCEERGANLLIINNKEEQEFLQKAIAGQYSYYWIGLSRNGGEWKWFDDTTLTLRLEIITFN
nr:C-type lectin domain family 10 member A-like [Misgurnus anguillicaudatus]